MNVQSQSLRHLPRHASGSLFYDPAALRELLQSGHDPNTTYLDGERVLEAERLCERNVSMLLRFGADVHALGTGGAPVGETLLYTAINEGDTALAAVLVQAGVDPDARSTDFLVEECRPLHALTVQSFGPGTHIKGPQMAAIVRLLVAAGADANALMNEATKFAARSTPLQLALNEVLPTSPYVVAALVMSGGAYIDVWALQATCDVMRRRAPQRAALRRWRTSVLLGGGGLAGEGGGGLGGEGSDERRNRRDDLQYDDLELQVCELALFCGWWRRVQFEVRKVCRRIDGVLLPLILYYLVEASAGAVDARCWAEQYNAGR